MNLTILYNKEVICKLTLMPLHKMATPIWSKMVATRWSAGEGSCGQSGQQGRPVRGDQTGRGGQLGVTRPAGEDSYG